AARQSTGHLQLFRGLSSGHSWMVLRSYPVHHSSVGHRETLPWPPVAGASAARHLSAGGAPGAIVHAEHSTDCLPILSRIDPSGDAVMSAVAASCVVFALIFAGALVGMLLRARLPEPHLSDESLSVIKLGVGLIATMAALVLGLLIASAKSSFDTKTT